LRRVRLRGKWKKRPREAVTKGWLILMTHEPAPCLLSVCLDVPADSSAGSFVYADGAGRALELLKLLRADLVVVSPAAMDGSSLPVWVRRMRAIAPWQKWVLAGDGITSRDELAARCNGALAVLDQPVPDDWSELIALARGVARGQRPAAMNA
jgi:hypothetical protein